MNQDFLAKMSKGDRAIAGGSVIVLVAMFLPWYGWDAGPFSASVDGFNSWGILTFLALLVVVALWLVRTFTADSVDLSGLPVRDAQLYLVGGGVEALGAVLFWLAYHNNGFGLANLGVRYGTFVALAGGAVTAYGGYLKQSEPAPSPSAGAPTPPSSYPSAPPPAAPPPPPPPA